LKILERDREREREREREKEKERKRERRLLHLFSVNSKSVGADGDLKFKKSRQPSSERYQLNLVAIDP